MAVGSRIQKHYLKSEIPAPAAAFESGLSGAAVYEPGKTRYFARSGFIMDHTVLGCFVDDRFGSVEI